MPQSEINLLLIERARAGQTVTRLKGGDPFLFGRGGEEAEALADAGIEWEVVPGISSGLAAASYAGIPLTHRQYSSSVAFITGHDGVKTRSDVDWAVTAFAADTLVVFMCGQTIAEIARRLIDAGRSPRTPLAVIRWGTYEDQEVFTGSLEDLADEDRAAIEPPAIAIIGDVVSLREKLHWFGREAQRFEEQAQPNWR
jgi:uroporphyrin-III C-methyltransferase